MEAYAEIADWAWEYVKSMEASASYLGNQMCRAMDSIGANLCEGFGRQYPGSVAQFYRYARGSALESDYWLDRAIARRLVPLHEGMPMLRKLRETFALIDQLIADIPQEKKR